MYTVRAWRWRYLLLPLGDIPVRRLFSITVVGFMAGMLIPRAQEGLRPYLVGRRYGIRPSAAFASIVLERLLDLTVVLLLLGLYAYVFPPHLEGDASSLLTGLKAAGGIAALASLGVGAGLFVFHRYSEKTLAVLDRILSPFPLGVGRFLLGFLRNFGQGLAVLRAPSWHLLAVFVQSALLWLTVDLSVYMNNRAFGLALPFQSSFLIVALLVIGVSVPTPGMVGGYHAAYRIALTRAFGVDPATAAAAAIAGHALTNLPVLILGMLLLRTEGLTLGRVRAISGETSPSGDASPAPDGKREELP
jgi:uncharacterized protein (TIRG00374 family)